MKKTGINKNVIMLCECAVMVALATVLSLIKIEFPYGGSITICSMRLILIIGYRYKPLVDCRQVLSTDLFRCFSVCQTLRMQLLGRQLL